MKQPDPDPYKIEKPDPNRSENQDLDSYQKVLDPQHWKE